MDKKTVFIKTAKGEQELSNLSGDLRRAMSLIDNKSTVDEMSRRAPPSLRDDLYEVLGELVAGEYIRDKNRPAEAKIVSPKITPPKIMAPKMFVPKQSTPSKSEELDFTSLASKPSFNPATAARTMGKDDEAELARAELEIAMAQSGMKPVVEDEASKEAKLRAKVAAAERARSELEAGIDAAKARASADAAAKAEAKARHEADVAARARAAAESKAMQEAANREQAEAKAKLEAAARMRAEQEAARETAKAQAALEAVAKSKAEADARVRAEIETAARARQVAEAKAKQDAEAARLKAEQEAVRVKAELDAAAKAKAEADAARIRVEQEAARVKAELEAAAKAKAEAEAARIKAEQEAARVKAELEAAKARAEAEAKALAAALAKQEAEEKARREAEEKARREAEEKARREAEEKARREAEEKARREAEEKARREAEEQVRLATEELARREAEATRLRAEQEAQAARIKTEQEAEAKARADAAASREAEERIRKEVVAAAAAQEVLARANSQKQTAKSEATPSFKIDLDNFLSEEQAHEDQLSSRPVDQAAEAEAKARREAAQRAVAEAKAEAEKISKPDMAAEMARLKAEADVARQKAEEEERRRDEERALAAEQAKAWAEAEQRAQAQAKIEAEQAVQQAALSQAKAANKSVQRKRREPLALGKIGFGLAVLALSAVVVLPYVYPLRDYIAPLEQRLSAQLKQPVRIGSMSAASIPPKLQLQNVTVGTEQDLQIANVVLSADILSLFSETKVLSDVQLEDVSIKGSQLERLAPSLKSLGGDKQFPVRHFTLQNVKVVTDEVALPSLSGFAELDGQGAFTRIALHSADEKYSVDLQPDQGRWQLGVSLKETSLPLLSDIVFSDLSAKGILSDGEVNFTEMDAHIFKGILLGSAKLSWRKGWQLQGRLEAKTFELDKMFPRYGIKGEMYGEGTFTLNGDKLSQLGGTRRLEASFTVKNGEIGAIDMVETARLLSRENLVGGRTRFDDLIGTVRVENGASDFRQLKIVSPMLSAGGSFDVSPTGQLSGNLNAEIKMRSGNNQMTLFGTLAEPKLRAGR
ncbi:MAG TPA: hypothetical protein DCK83_13580 [Gallionellaceae bacterium]|nr:hypothetical protein [Gallionellaceae bacterium]